MVLSISLQAFSQVVRQNPPQVYSLSTPAGVPGSFSNYAAPLCYGCTLLVGPTIVNAPPGFSVNLFSCQTGSNYCSYDVKWCFDQPGTYTASITFDLTTLGGGTPIEVIAPTVYQVLVTVQASSTPAQCPGGPKPKPTPAPTPMPIPDLSVGQISIPSANLEADSKLSVSPGTHIDVVVPVSGANIQANDGRSVLVTLQYGPNILGASYSKEFSPNEDPNDAATDELPSTIMINDQSAIAGQYKIDIYKTSAGTAELRVEGYDVNGYLNQMFPVSQTMKAGDHVQIIYQHTDQALIPAQIDVSKALFFEGKKEHWDRITLEGKLILPAGRSGLDISEAITLSVGNFSKRIDIKELHKHKEQKGFEYSYHQQDLSFELEENGKFGITIRNPGFDIIKVSSEQQVDLQLDGIYGTLLVKFKVIDKDSKDNDHDYGNLKKDDR